MPSEETRMALEYGCDSSRIRNIALATQKDPSAATAMVAWPGFEFNPVRKNAMQVHMETKYRVGQDTAAMPCSSVFCVEKTPNAVQIKRPKTSATSVVTSPVTPPTMSRA